MPTRSKKTTRISVSLEPQNYNDLSQIAEKSDTSLAWVIRRAIVEFLDRQRTGALGQLPFGFEEQQAKR
jgi:predicted transcriptional regulator